MEATQVGQDRVKIDIDRELEDQILKLLPQTQELPELIEKLLQKWLEGVEAKGGSTEESLVDEADGDSYKADFVDAG